MTEKRFSREDYPFDILAEFGLTENMIYDLPDFVHETLEAGGKSPLLPVVVSQPYGYTRLYARFSIIDTDEGPDILFSPKLKSADLAMFTEAEQSLLLDGKVIVADIEEPTITDEGVEDTQTIRAFVQLDPDTNGIVYCPTQVIGRNLRAISNDFDLDGDIIKSLWQGSVVTFRQENDEGELEDVTIGIDLMSDKGTLIVPGDAKAFMNAVHPTIPRYNFGNDGCWVHHNGLFDYVPEADFTQEMLDEITRRAKEQRVQSSYETDQTVGRTETEHQAVSESEEDNRQIGR